MLSINTNVFSLTAQAALSNNQNPLQTSMERLSTGLRINSAADDAAGLAIATGMQSQVNGLNTAVTNANNGVGLLQTAQGALTSITNNLQSIRELAVESANSTNTPQNRTSLNTEAQQLISEIDRVATSTQFNNVNLLDGSFQNAAFQVGANAGQTITVSTITSARTSALSGAATGYSTTVNGSADTLTTATAAALVALNAGDLTINHVAVGSSVAGTATADQTADSAWAIANAINAAKVPHVTATTTQTSVAVGSATATVSAIAAGAFTVNGVAIGAIASAANGSFVTMGSQVATAINLLTSATGVTAAANAVTGAITLTDAQGGDITLGGTVADIGSSAAAATTQAQVVLSATSGGITIGGNVPGNVQLTAGTTYTDSAGATGSAPAALTYGALTLNGVTIQPSEAGNQAGQTTDSAWAIAAAINSTTGANVTAIANATSTGPLASATATASVAAGAFLINGVSLGAIAAASSASGEGLLVAQAVNLISSQTGVTASADAVTGVITLTAADGRDIGITTTGSSSMSSAYGLGATSSAANLTTGYQGSISLTSTGSSGIAIGGTSASSVTGLAAGTTAAGVSSVTTFVSGIDISTASGATAALATIDGALNEINLSNASLGAYQNRFVSAVTTLQNTSNNLNSAKSNIMDADYAVETSNLTKRMIAQQAGIAVLAQANTIPQQILSLLPKG